MEIFPILILFLTGIISGLYSGNVGGGAFLSFPVLIAMGIPTHIAIATLRFAGPFLSLSATLRFSEVKKLNLKPGILFGIIAATGAVIGANIVVNIDEKIINLIIAIIFAAAFFIILFNKKIGTQKKHLRRLKHPSIPYIAVFFLGIYGGFFGGGFATLVMLMLAFLGRTFIESSALSKLISLIMALSAMIVFAWYGLINYSLGLSLGLGYALGAWIGISYALKYGNSFFRILLLVIIAATTTKLCLNFLGINIL